MLCVRDDKQIHTPPEIIVSSEWWVDNMLPQKKHVRYSILQWIDTGVKKYGRYSGLQWLDTRLKKHGQCSRLQWLNTGVK